MRNLRMNRKPAIGIGIAAIVAVLCLSALASDSARIEKPAAVDAEQYADFLSLIHIYISSLYHHRTKAVPRPYLPRSMLASSLRHPRIKSALALTLYPALHAACI